MIIKLENDLYLVVEKFVAIDQFGEFYVYKTLKGAEEIIITTQNGPPSISQNSILRRNLSEKRYWLEVSYGTPTRGFRIVRLEKCSPQYYDLYL